MNYSFHPEAKEEFLEEINYFERCRAGLGLEFLKEIFSTIQRIIHFPSAWSKFSQNTRRCLTNRFPFGLLHLNPRPLESSAPACASALLYFCSSALFRALIHISTSDTNCKVYWRWVNVSVSPI